MRGFVAPIIPDSTSLNPGYAGYRRPTFPSYLASAHWPGLQGIFGITILNQLMAIPAIQMIGCRLMVGKKHLLARKPVGDIVNGKGLTGNGDAGIEKVERG